MLKGVFLTDFNDFDLACTPVSVRISRYAC